MTRVPAVLLALALLAGWRAADDKEDVEQALFKTAASENYSWTAMTIEEKDGKLPQLAETLEGKASRNGWCRIVRPKTKNTAEAWLKGDRVAMLTPDGWRSIAIQAAPEGEKLDKTVQRAQEFLRARTPLAEAKVLLGRVQDLSRQSNGLYTGRLAEKDVEIILQSATDAGMSIPTFENPKLRANFRIAEGQLASYELVVSGRELKKKGNGGELLISVAVDFSDVGTTTLEVPEDARKLLE